MTASHPAGEAAGPAPDARTQINGFAFSLLLIDPQGVIAEANPEAESLLGQSSARLCGAYLGDVLNLTGSGLDDRLEDRQAQIVARGISIGIQGRPVLVNVTVSSLHGTGGWRVLTLSDATRDDVATDRSEEQTLQAPSILAHEIKNPLAAIRGAGQLLARKLELRDRHLTDMIASEVARIAALIDRMQELGSNAGTSLRTVNLHHTVRLAMASVRTATGGVVELHEQFDPSLPDVLAAEAQLQQVLINLLSNAVDACRGQDQSRVTVRTRFVSGLTANVEQLGKAVQLPIEISVLDTGPGIDPALTGHIFEPFVTSKPNGQGLGLPLVRKLVRDMGGRIGHSRDEQTGQTCFRIHLARAED